MTMTAVPQHQLTDHPWAIVRIDRRRFSVMVVAHCKRHAAAQGTVDMLTKYPESQEHVIVGSSQLVDFLYLKRAEMSTLMDETFNVN